MSVYFDASVLVSLFAKDVFSDDQKQEYEVALEKLGEETRGHKETN